MKRKIILIDSNNIAYRAFYALPDTIMTASGVVTNAVLGFTNIFLKIVEDLRPDVVICAFDSKGPTFRHKMFDQYKVHRKKMPDELAHQLPLIKEVMEAFNVSCIEQEGMEADDVLASIVRKAAGDEIVIVTGDKDMLQMVSDDIKVLSSKRTITDTVIYDSEGVIKKMGVAPEKVRDLLALMGDSSDNIPGVPGIGPKTAVKLINQFGGIDEILANIDSIKSAKLKEILKGNTELAVISRKLATLKDDLKIDDAILEGSFKCIDFGKVKETLERLEFTSIIKRLPRYRQVMDIKEGSIPAGDAYDPDVGVKKYPGAIDTPDGRIYIAYPGREDKSRAPVIYAGGSEAYPAGMEALEDSNLKRILEDPGIVKTGIGLKQAVKFFKKSGITMAGRLNDLEIMYLALNPVKAKADISDISAKVLGIDIDSAGRQDGGSGESPAGQKQMKLGLEGEAEETIEEKYAGAIKGLDLYGELEKKLAGLLEENGLTGLYKDIEEPLITILAEMEYTGVAIDTDYLDNLIDEYDAGIKKLTKEIYGLCGMQFNINSSQQLADVLYRKMGLPAHKKTKTGYSTDAATLKAIRDNSPVIDKILDYREKSKLKNTYVDVLPQIIDPEDGRIHTSYNQMGTTTGRISSSDPNLQNIPIRTEYGKQIRKAFIPGRGYDLLLSSDYSQIELRVLAHLSGDENLIGSFNRDEDIHSRTASEVFEVEYDKVPAELRRKAKAINFGIIYGMTDFGLASRLSITPEEAGDYIKRYFNRYPGVDIYLKNLIESAKKTGYSTTMFGRKRYIRELGSSNGRIRSLGERLAVNTPLQGSAADIMKLSTIKLHDRIKSEGIDSNIILHVHDEIVLELLENDIKAVEKVVRESMEGILKLKVRLQVDIKTGHNWYI